MVTHTTMGYWSSCVAKHPFIYLALVHKVGAPIPVTVPIPVCIQGTSIRVTPILGG